MLEKHVEAACDRLMAGLGYTAIRFSQARATMQSPGIPDRKYYNGGHSFWLEVKRPGGKQSDYQRVFQFLAESAGEQYVLGGLDELARFLVDFAPLNRLQREALRVQFGIPAPPHKVPA